MNVAILWKLLVAPLTFHQDFEKPPLGALVAWLHTEAAAACAIAPPAMASSEDYSMDEGNEKESEDDLEQKRVIAILQPKNRSDNTRDSQGRLRLKVGSPTRGVALRAAAAYFTREQPHCMVC